MAVFIFMTLFLLCHFAGEIAVHHARDAHGNELTRLHIPLRREIYIPVYARAFRVDWDDINLQDEVEEAKAELYREQARKLRIENDREENRC